MLQKECLWEERKRFQMMDRLRSWNILMIWLSHYYKIQKAIGNSSKSKQKLYRKITTGIWSKISIPGSMVGQGSEPALPQGKKKNHLKDWIKTCPGWCDSVDCVPACEPKGRWFDSQSGHMPGLRARSPVRATYDATTHWCFSPSLSPSLSLCLKINK